SVRPEHGNGCAPADRQWAVGPAMTAERVRKPAEPGAPRGRRSIRTMDDLEDGVSDIAGHAAADAADRIGRRRPVADFGPRHRRPGDTAAGRAGNADDTDRRGEALAGAPSGRLGGIIDQGAAAYRLQGSAVERAVFGR